VKAEDKAGFAIYDEPDVMLDPVDFDDSFVSMPLVGMEVHRRNELDGDVIEKGRKFSAPVGDSNVGHFDIIQHFEDQSNISR